MPSFCTFVKIMIQVPKSVSKGSVFTSKNTEIKLVTCTVLKLISKYLEKDISVPHKVGKLFLFLCILPKYTVPCSKDCLIILRDKNIFWFLISEYYCIVCCCSLKFLDAIISPSKYIEILPSTVHYSTTSSVWT